MTFSRGRKCRPQVPKLLARYSVHVTLRPPHTLDRPPKRSKDISHRVASDFISNAIVKYNDVQCGTFLFVITYGVPHHYGPASASP